MGMSDEPVAPVSSWMLLNRLVSRFDMSVEQVKAAAAEFMFRNGDNGAMYTELPGGVAGVIIARRLHELTAGEVYDDLLSNVRAATDRIVSGFRLEEWVPPEIVVRDALALVVQLRRVLRPLTRGNTEKRRALVDELSDVGRRFTTADEVVGLSLAELTDIVGGLNSL